MDEQTNHERLEEKLLGKDLQDPVPPLPQQPAQPPAAIPNQKPVIATFPLENPPGEVGMPISPLEKLPGSVSIREGFERHKGTGPGQTIPNGGDDGK